MSKHEAFGTRIECSVLSAKLQHSWTTRTYEDADLSSRTSKTELLAVAIILAFTSYRQPYLKISESVSRMKRYVTLAGHTPVWEVGWSEQSLLRSVPQA